MSEQIKVGDLVVIVNYCCSDIDLGKILTVTGFTKAACPMCGAKCDSCAFLGGYWAPPLSWLRRIPPLSELESTQEEAVA